MKKNPPSIRLFRRPSKPFPRVKTPAAYVRVPCYPPGRVSNFEKDFLAGAYHWTSKESKHVFGFVRGEARLWEGCSRSLYVLGIRMVWQCCGLVSEILYGHTIHYKRGKCLVEKII